MKRLTLILLLIVLFAFPSVVLADVAPPYNPPGSNPEPGTDATQVRMVSENVLIAVNSDTLPGSLGSAHVIASFNMRNLGTADESMAVRFPISANDGRDQYPEIADISIKVDGRQVSYRRANYPDVRYQSADVPWAEFDVSFPVNQDVNIEVAYTLSGSGYYPYTAFYYILATGTGWNDTIGSADVTLRLPYPASPQNIILDTQIGWAETTPGGSMQGNEMHWHFENFEPGPYEVVENMEFALVAPSAWQTVLNERDNVSKAPNDGEAWGRLAKAYKEIFFMTKAYRTDAGGKELYKLSVEAYDKCLALLPQDAQWHAGFADLLAGHSYWDSFMGNPTPETYQALNEIHTALELAPNDPVVKEIAQNISYMFPDGMTQNGTSFDFPWLTQTPTPLPPTPTIAASYDPAVVAGTYHSDLLTLANNTRAQLTLTLGTDHSATLESRSEDNQSVVSSGTWQDYGDSSIRVSVEDPNRRQSQFAFSLQGDNLQATEYSSFYGEAGVSMTRVGTATATPSTPEPQQPTPSPNPPTPTPPLKPASPICGSAALAPLMLALWWNQKRKR